MLSPALKDRLSSPWIGRVAAVAAVIGLAALYWATDRTFTVEAGGHDNQYSTHARTVGEALQDAGLQLQQGDAVFPDVSSPLRQGMTVEIQRAFTVSIDVDGKSSTERARSWVPENLLATMGIRVFPGDLILVDGLPVDDPGAPVEARPTRLEWKPGTQITLDTGRGVLRFRTSASTVAGALEQAGLTLYKADAVSPEPAAPITGPMSVTYRPSRPVQVDVDGRTLDARTSAATVGGALGQAGVSLVGLDFAKPSVDKPVPEGGEIKVVRVSEQVRVELTPVAFETQYQPLNDVEIDQQRLIKAGAYGVEAHQVRVRYEDGVEKGRIEEGSWLAKAPDPRVVGYGTNIVIRSVSTDDGTIEYWRAVQMWATSYSPSRAGVSPDARNFGITASGQPLTKGLVAIDRRYIPFGTRMYVPGYGYALAADTGGGVKGRWIDLGYDDDNYVSWHQYVTVYFLTPVPPEGSIVWIFP
jgi:uncharacterized protein YabE (DUF348 family)